MLTHFRRLDLPAVADKLPDTPGAFKRLMKAKEIAEKKALEKKEKKEGDKQNAEVCWLRDTSHLTYHVLIPFLNNRRQKYLRFDPANE